MKAGGRLRGIMSDYLTRMSSEAVFARDGFFNGLHQLLLIQAQEFFLDSTLTALPLAANRRNHLAVHPPISVGVSLPERTIKIIAIQSAIGRPFDVVYRYGTILNRTKLAP